MSKVVGQRLVGVGKRDKTRVGVKCCEDAKLRIASLEKTNRLLRELANNINPHVESGMIIVFLDEAIKLNYCPVCGDKYREATK